MTSIGGITSHKNGNSRVVWLFPSFMEARVLFLFLVLIDLFELIAFKDRQDLLGQGVVDG